MKAAWYEQAGPAKTVMAFGELPEPMPGPGEVRIRIMFSACNPHDVKKRSNGRELEQFGRIIPNCDGSGEIDFVGEGVSPSRIGERVWLFAAQIGQGSGTGAQYCVVPAWKAVALPTCTSFEEGACLGIPVITAYHAVFSGGPVEGQTLFIPGGYGRVGCYAVQLAKLSGATVISTVGCEEQMAQLKELGADHVFNYRDDDLAGQIRSLEKRVDRFISGAFARDIELATRVLSPLGNLAAFGFDDNPLPSFPCLRLSAKNIGIRFIAIFNLPETQQESAFEHINRHLITGSLHHRVGTVFELPNMAKAHETVEQNTVPGATLINIGMTQ